MFKDFHPLYSHKINEWYNQRSVSIPIAKISCWFRWVCQSSTRTWPGDRRGLCRVPTCASHGLFNFLSICSNSSVLSWFPSRDSPWKMGTLGMSRKRHTGHPTSSLAKDVIQTSFFSALKVSRGLLLILDEDATPFSRTCDQNFLHPCIAIFAMQVMWKLLVLLHKIVKYSITGGWFGTFFIFPYIGNNDPNRHIFQRGRSTTNQIRWYEYAYKFCRILKPPGFGAITSSIRLSWTPTWSWISQ